MEFQVSGPNGLWISRPSSLIVRDATAMVDVTILTAQANTGYGLVFRQINFDNDCYYH
jgi:hypothetical protein